MYIYKKAYPVLFRIGIAFLIMNCFLLFISWSIIIHILILLVSMLVFIFIIGFFRIPERRFVPDESLIYAPADGTIVAIDEVYEKEFLNKNCKKISIFMSVFNVHQNRIPVSGKVVYFKHHPGKYLVAWNPKASLKNERTSVVVENSQGIQLMVCQIAGIVARRIICNLQEGDTVRQGDELGFILFGSRVDVMMPMWTKIIVKPGDKVKANKHVIAELGSL
ncbi:MAG: phosphatidylserine decarboxylase family protein [Bacteroidales bacterium]|nr:phosphatidylserine decarboxylase family protein [Bacteroidales bacterium]